MSEYIHGYTQEEQDRLLAQNDVLAKYIYDRLDFTESKKLLEVGVGVGAHMIYLLKKYPNLHITGVDISDKQIATARKNLEAAGISSERYRLLQADARDTGFEELEVDTVLLIWVLEHVPQPQKVLAELKRILKPNTKIYITEVFNSSLSFHPPKPAIQKYWGKLHEFQSNIGGDGNIGLRLGALLHDIGFRNFTTSPYPLMLDKRNREGRAEIFKYWKGLAHSSHGEMKEAGYTTDEDWAEASVAFDQLLEAEDGIFYYSFVQAEIFV